MTGFGDAVGHAIAPVAVLGLGNFSETWRFLDPPELIRSKHDARNRLIDLESSTDQELDALKREFEAMRSGAAASPKEASEKAVGEAAASQPAKR